ncbi:MAG: ubiquinol oxidase subunit II [Candidatus Doudnabacteria bacterium]|nr:ubiquinol oxidase subunit II [Candidatus Doudnabacteria bacterium]
MPGRYKKYKLSEHKLTCVSLITATVALALVLLIGKSNVALLNPKGWVAWQESKLIVQSVLIMLIVVIPTFAAAFFISRKYRQSNVKAAYTPEAVNSRTTQIVLWAIPSVIVAVLIFKMWNGAHELDPFRPLHAQEQPMTIQVVALQWKWLFIYPDLNIATVNFVQIPESTPINFELTSDAPMNSFWIPSLGGQMYAMPGMATKLQLIADTTGDFAGSAAEINGKGFAGMKFMARSSSRGDFNTWVQSVQNSSSTLTWPDYENLAKPSENIQPAAYASVQGDLFAQVMTKYMPEHTHQ